MFWIAQGTFGSTLIPNFGMRIFNPKVALYPSELILDLPWMYLSWCNQKFNKFGYRSQEDPLIRLWVNHSSYKRWCICNMNQQKYCEICIFNNSSSIIKGWNWQGVSVLLDDVSPTHAKLLAELAKFNGWTDVVGQWILMSICLYVFMYSTHIIIFLPSFRTLLSRFFLLHVQ